MWILNKINPEDMGKAQMWSPAYVTAFGQVGGFLGCSSEMQEWPKPGNRYYIVSPTVASQYLIKCNCMNLSW